jgi:hypothetical protein
MDHCLGLVFTDGMECRGVVHSPGAETCGFVDCDAGVGAAGNTFYVKVCEGKFCGICRQLFINNVEILYIKQQ